MDSLNEVKVMLQGRVELDGGANLGGGLEYGAQSLDQGMAGVGAGVAEGLDLMGVVNMPGGVSVSPLSLGGGNCWGKQQNWVWGYGGGIPGNGWDNGRGLCQCWNGRWDGDGWVRDFCQYWWAQGRCHEGPIT